MKELDYMAVADRAMKQIKKGAFLTVRSEKGLNTMTIGWATIGFVWRKPIFMIAVRNSRHTFGIIEKAADFTVSVPSGDLKEAIAFCGTKSGRDYDKLKECSLATAEARKTISPVIDIPGIHFECGIVFKAPMDPAYLDQTCEQLYPEKDYHTLYFGEILHCYEF